jgi:hypothetical protein
LHKYKIQISCEGYNKQWKEYIQDAEINITLALIFGFSAYYFLMYPQIRDIIFAFAKKSI